MKTTIETITPAIAQALLQGNVSNRRLRTDHVKTLAEAMKRDEWKLTHQGLAIGIDGRLLDGQHRLHAVIQAKMAIPMMVTRDAPDDTFSAIDIGGAKRRVADAMVLEQKLAEIYTGIYRLQTAGQGHGTVAQIQHIADVFQNEAAEVYALIRHRRSAIFSSVVFKAAATVSLKMKPENKAYILDIYKRLLTHDTAGAPPIVNALLRMRAENRLKSVNGIGAWSYLAHCANWTFDPKNKDVTFVRALEVTIANNNKNMRSIISAFLEAA